MFWKKLKIIFSGVTIIILLGCAQMQANQRAEEYKQLIEPGIGSATKELVIQKWGMPTRTFKAGDLEVWEYHKSFGTVGGVYTNYGAYSGYGVANAREVYDNVTFTFNAEGILISYKVYVQR